MVYTNILLGTGEELDLLVFDFADVLWNVPLMASDRSFFVRKLRFRYFFLRAARGSRNGPLARAGVVQFAIRLVRARLWEGGECPARINTSVDDPLTVVRGTETRRSKLVACLVLRIIALGFRSFVKELHDLADEALLHNFASRMCFSKASQSSFGDPFSI